MVSYNLAYVTDRYYFDDEPFDSLMQNRIIEVLLICSQYDRFMLEEDGRIEEQLFQEYVSLGLRYPPRFTDAGTPEAAFEQLEKRKFDLVITMLNAGETQALDLGREIKDRYPDTPIVVLTRFSRDVSLQLEEQDLSFVDYVFSWLGNASILLAIVKLLEDRLNVEHDVDLVGVQTIILVENSVRYYSSYLPTIYRSLFLQAREIMAEGLNEHQQTLRMRGRPKILLATDYEEAITLYQRFRKNLLGVISDIAYHRGGELDHQAGLALCRHIRATDPECPILLQSSQPQMAVEARRHNAAFIYKHSTHLLNDLRDYIRNNYGFGDFVFRMPGSMDEIDRARNLVELQRKLRVVASESVRYHVSNHHFSKWLKARALYSLARVVRPKTIQDFETVESVRDFIVDTIKNYRLHVGRGVIAQYDRNKYDEYSVFQRIGRGSLGGKARGIAFINTFLKRQRIMFRFDRVAVQIPKTVVLATDVFERFMDMNDLYELALSDRDDAEILQAFLKARLPDDVTDDLRFITQVIHNPLAVRSSSLLEDSYFQPFAGIYATYFVPNTNPDIEVRLRHLSDAIKGVYASTYYRDSKSYAQATHNLVDEEQMAVIIQEVTGKVHGPLFYPTLSGVARSLNFYPMERERTDEGVVNVALGLGKTIVDGGVSLRFSPAHPKKILQLSDTDLALKSTQQQFWAINLDDTNYQVTTDQATGLAHVDVKDAAGETSTQLLWSTYDFQNHVLRDAPSLTGRKVLTFAPILKYDMFPLAEILQTLLDVGQQQMNVPVEIEFAVELDPPSGLPLAFKFLQIRPIVEGLENEVVRLDGVAAEDCIVQAQTALGNGIYDDLLDLVYVKPSGFNLALTPRIVDSIEMVNTQMVQEKRGYVLIGPGRWGSTDPWLGIPVKWSNITQARIIIEAGLKSFWVEPSQGSHFFQNLTSFRVASLTINPAFNDGSYDLEYLDAQPALFEDEFVRHLRFDSPMLAKVDGRQGSGGIKAVLLKPGRG
ncbi:MAG: PEP/pyruvate-binding domain-containing protein [Pseudomonadota bacterium]